jgi:hypothetical protein
MGTLAPEPHRILFTQNVLHLEPKIKIIEEENIQEQFHLWAFHQERKPWDHWTKEFPFFQYLLTK